MKELYLGFLGDVYQVRAHRCLGDLWVAWVYPWCQRVMTTPFYHVLQFCEFLVQDVDSNSSELLLSSHLLDLARN